jgi:hypothetical protein
LSYDPTPTQALLLFGLLARHGACAQAEMMPKVKKADREALIKAKLISSTPKRPLLLTLEDLGWAWTAENLGTAEFPPAHRTLCDFCARLSEHLAKSGETLADFIGSRPDNISPPQPASLKGGKSGSKSKPKPPSPAAPKRGKGTKLKSPSPAALRKRIEAAYLALTNGRKNQTVSLARLRAELSDLDRATVDAALERILKGDKTASLMRHDDPRQLNQADHDAAFSPAGEPFHVIWIAS